MSFSLFLPLWPFSSSSPRTPIKGTSGEPWGLFINLSGNVGFILREPLPPVWGRTGTYSSGVKWLQRQDVKEMGRRLCVQASDCVLIRGRESDFCVCVHVSVCPVGLCACVCFSVPGFDVWVFERMLFWDCFSLSFPLFIKEMCV